MTWAPRSVTLALLSMALAGCSASDMMGGNEQIAGTYQCDDGKTFSFTTTRGSETVTLDLAGQKHQMQQEPGLSGISKYSDGTLSVWTQTSGRFATLEGTAEPYVNCEASAWDSGGVIQ